jgi:hypothetical protein
MHITALAGLFLSAAPGPVVLSPANLHDLMGGVDARNLVDEQAGLDPRAGKNGPPSTIFPQTFSTQYYPYEAVIDLGRARNLTELWYYDANGIGNLALATGDIGAWDTLPDISTSSYNTWKSVPVNRRTRFVRLVARDNQARVAEIVLYSDTADTVPPPSPWPARTPAARPTLRQFMGIDGFVDDQPVRLAPFGAVREYHDWQWDEGNGSASYPGYPNNQFAWNPSWPGWSFDAFYDTLRSRGIEANPDLQKSVPWMDTSDANLEHRPVPAGEDPTLPYSYRAHARWMHQFAARFGSRTLPADSLLLRAGNSKVSGLGTVHVIEDWNEPDKDWEGEKGRFRPAHLAAMISADWDGHHGALGWGHGMSAADPSIRMAWPGITKFDTAYLATMSFLLQRMRGDIPGDVLNFHHYCNDGGDQNGTHTVGISPEADSLRAKLARVVAWRDRNLPGRSIWLSEFGWDTQQHSTQRAPTIAPDDSLETQARWIVRGFMEAFASGIDRAHLFYTRDYASWDATNFNSSGVLFTAVKDSSGTWHKPAPKPSWHYCAVLSRQLGDWIWDGDESGVPAGLRGARLRKPGTDSVAWVVWSPTATGQVVAGASLRLGVASASRIDLVRGDSLGTVSAAIATGGAFTMDVSEKPFLLKASNPAGIARRATTALGGVEVFDLRGRPLGRFASESAARSAGPRGIQLWRMDGGAARPVFLPGP